MFELPKKIVEAMTNARKKAADNVVEQAANAAKSAHTKTLALILSISSQRIWEHQAIILSMIPAPGLDRMYFVEANSNDQALLVAEKHHACRFLSTESAVQTVRAYPSIFGFSGWLFEVIDLS